MVEADKCAIIHEWFEIILPMTADGEKTVQDKAMSEINVQECFLSLPNSRKILFYAPHVDAILKDSSFGVRPNRPSVRTLK